MKLKKNYNNFIFLVIIIIAIYLWTIFTKIHYDPNYVMKGHHDYPINGFLIFAGYTYCWGIFVMGLVQLKYYLNGKDKLKFITIIYSCLIGYILFLLLEGNLADLSNISPGRFKKSMAVIIPSIIVLILSRTKYAKEIHIKSKLQEIGNGK